MCEIFAINSVVVCTLENFSLWLHLFSNVSFQMGDFFSREKAYASGSVHSLARFTSNWTWIHPCEWKIVCISLRYSFFFCRWDACSYWHMPSHLNNSRSSRSSRILLFSFSYTLPDAMQFYELENFFAPSIQLTAGMFYSEKYAKYSIILRGLNILNFRIFWFLSMILDLMIEFFLSTRIIFHID